MSTRLPPSIPARLPRIPQAVANAGNAVANVGTAVADNLTELTDEVSDQIAQQANDWGFSFNLPTILIVVGTIFVTYWILSWLFGSSTPSPPIVIPQPTIVPIMTEQPRSRGDGREVFNIKDDVYSYHQAQLTCQKYGALMATGEQMAKAHSNGANWCHLGWLQGRQAYYPTQSEQISEAEKWPKELREGCGKVGLNGGSYPPQLKLTVNCYGNKPTMQSSSITPFNTVTNKWSAFS
jgi:hypothetical protein